MQSAPSSEFRIPDPELEGSVELPRSQSSALAADPGSVRQDPFPRRMLYVEGVLYFGCRDRLRSGLSRRSWRLIGRQRRCQFADAGVDGKVWLVQASGAKRGDAGAVVIVLPADKSPVKMPLDGLRPSDQGDAKSAALSTFGGAATAPMPPALSPYLSRSPAATIS